MKKSVVYKWTCLICQEAEKKTLYFGESSRTLYERMAEHMAQINKMDSENPTVDHHQTEHIKEEDKPRLKLELVWRVVKPLERQVLEGYLIGNQNEDVLLMNRKGDWGQNLPPGLS